MGARKILIACASATWLAALTSCTTLPDTSGYTAASYQLNSSTVAAGKAVESEFDRMTLLLPPDRRVEAQNQKGRFTAAWATTTKSMGGLARYAESIQELTDAGNKGREGARGVAASLSSLADAVGILPGAGVVGLATDTFALVNTAIANARAASSLKRSLAAADPLIADIAVAVDGQVDTARAQFDAALQIQRGTLDFAVQDILPLDERLALQERPAEVALARATDANREAERHVAAANLERIRLGRAALAPRMTAYHQALDALDEREQAGHDLFDATEKALAAWRESHSNVVRALEERKPVSFASLMAASEEIKELSRRWREL